MLRVTKVTFPGLFPNLEIKINSVAFSIFGHEFPWYALIITAGIVFCFFYVIYRSRRVGIIPDTVIDIGVVTVLMGIIGARIYYVLTSWDSYKDNLIDVFKIWEGGIAIYGALIGGGLGVYLMCRRKKVSFNVFADCVAPSLLMAQAMGRWGNFFNAEAYGSTTNIFCRMGLQRGNGTPIYVHPTFLYESIWNLIGFLIANALYKRKKYDGFILHFVFAWYGFGRMFIEVLRQDSLYISSYQAWFTKISVLVGFAFFVLCTTFIIRNFIRIHKGEELPLTPQGEPVSNPPLKKNEK